MGTQFHDHIHLVPLVQRLGRLLDLMGQVDKMNLEDYSYLLQKKNIALYPSKKRENSKLLVYKSKKITDTLFNKIINYIPRGSTIFFNDTKVIKCRFLFIPQVYL